MKDGDGLSSHGVKQLRGGNGALQWLVTNSRPDLAAAVSLSQGNVTTMKIADHAQMNKLVRQAKKDADFQIHIHCIPMDRLSYGRILRCIMGHPTRWQLTRRHVDLWM